MTWIETERRPDLDRTIHTVHGPFTAADVIGVIRTEWSAHPTRDVLWDFCDADPARLTVEELRSIVEEVRRHAHLRPGGRTVLVGGDDLGFGVARMHVAYSEIEHSPIAYHVARSRAEGEAWLDAGSPA
jgi:hypothetical protein